MCHFFVWIQLRDPIGHRPRPPLESPTFGTRLFRHSFQRVFAKMTLLPPAHQDKSHFRLPSRASSPARAAVSPIPPPSRPTAALTPKPIDCICEIRAAPVILTKSESTHWLYWLTRSQPISRVETSCEVGCQPRGMEAEWDPLGGPADIAASKPARSLPNIADSPALTFHCHSIAAECRVVGFPKNGSLDESSSDPH